MPNSTPELPKLTPRQRAKLLRYFGFKSLPGMKPYRPKRKPSPKGSRPNTSATAARPVRCITTGETFPSITQAAHSHGVPISNIATHLKHGKPAHVRQRTYEYLDPVEPAPRTPSHSTAPRPVRCINDGQQFRSISAAARHYNIAPANLHSHLHGGLRHVKNLTFEWIVTPQ